jgi:hypothetical protein
MKVSGDSVFESQNAQVTTSVSTNSIYFQYSCTTSFLYSHSENVKPSEVLGAYENSKLNEHYMTIRGTNAI